MAFPSGIGLGVNLSSLSSARTGSLGSERFLAKAFAVPKGTTPKGMDVPAIPCKTPWTVPSPPQAMTVSQEFVARRARSRAESGCGVVV